MVDSKEILVLGGNGKTGRRVAERLQRIGSAVRIASRLTEPKFDWLDKSTWKHVLADVESVYIAFQPDLAAPALFSS